MNKVQQKIIMSRSTFSCSTPVGIVLMAQGKCNHLCKVFLKTFNCTRYSFFLDMTLHHCILGFRRFEITQRSQVHVSKCLARFPERSGARHPVTTRNISEEGLTRTTAETQKHASTNCMLRGMAWHTPEQLIVLYRSETRS
jgi:hypothetical protein